MPQGLWKDQDIQMHTFASKILTFSLEFDFEEKMDSLTIPDGYRGEYLSDWLEDIKTFFPKESYRERTGGDSRGVVSLTESIIIDGMYFLGSQKWNALETNVQGLKRENRKEIDKQISEGLIDAEQKEVLLKRHILYVKQWLAANRYRHTETQFEYEQRTIISTQKEWLEDVPPLFAQAWILKHKKRVEQVKNYKHADTRQRLEALYMYVKVSPKF